MKHYISYINRQFNPYPTTSPQKDPQTTIQLHQIFQQLQNFWNKWLGSSSLKTPRTECNWLPHCSDEHVPYQPKDSECLLKPNKPPGDGSSFRLLSKLVLPGLTAHPIPPHHSHDQRLQATDSNFVKYRTSDDFFSRTNI